MARLPEFNHMGQDDCFAYAEAQLPLPHIKIIQANTDADGQWEQGQTSNI
jgi:hypothetical protein